MSKSEFETTNPTREVLIAWLEEGAIPKALTNKALRRLCFEAARMLRNEPPDYLDPPEPDVT